jgi:GrpE protein
MHVTTKKEPRGDAPRKQTKTAAVESAVTAPVTKTSKVEGTSRVSAATYAAAAVRARARKTVPQPEAPAPRATRSSSDAGDTVLRQLGELKAMVAQLLTPTVRDDDGLEGSVDSLRRLLSELIEERMETTLTELVRLRQDAAAPTDANRGRLVQRLDDVLATLGAVRFDAEPLDLVDPLIHTIVEERHAQGHPEGVILQMLRPGYRTARGRLLCKAAVVVSQGA